ncbi:hypothetical protein SPAR139_0550 [Streptococcus pneumoniae EU-NP04]|nr:hypothetical protein SPAR87_2075 [Streptococcus pneumoniae GA47033]EHZ95876.1 hypothetical protein SPAR139_0550 [Streptococcus pneumoniae EU-NP04]
MPSTFIYSSKVKNSFVQCHFITAFFLKKFLSSSSFCDKTVLKNLSISIVITLKPIHFFISKQWCFTLFVRIVVITITAKLFQCFYLIIGCPNNQRNTVKFFNFPLIHFIFEVPFYNSLIILMKKLLYIPSKHFSSCIPFIKPVLYCLTIFILRTPALNINYII